MKLFNAGIIFLLVVFYTVQGNSQGNPYTRTDLIAPSPNAASLGKFGNMPVSYYTGLPNVSIPIFTVEGNDLKLPITLSYHYSGHRPAEEASWVGLGWTLQAGGVITRTLGDKVDELNQGYSSGYSATPSATDLENQNWLAWAITHKDLAPDVFNFSFAGYSGKFILYEDAFTVMPAQRLAITGNANDGFKIITEDGTQYFFNRDDDPNGPNYPNGTYYYETTGIKSSGYEPFIPQSHKSSWYLRRITNASNTESIDLAYDSEGPIRSHGMMVQTVLTGPPGFATVISSPQSSFESNITTAKRLSWIHSDKYSVHFSAELSRQDIDGLANYLETIDIYANGQSIKSFTFDTEYFGSGGHSGKYLKLKRLREVNVGSTEFIDHVFEYEHENEYAFFGDAYTSLVDHYGYMKGPGGSGLYVPNTLYPGGANRDPNSEWAKSGALKKIKYPTGGTTELEYEGNTYYDGEKYNYSYIGTGASRALSHLNNTILQAVDTFSTNFPQTISLTVTRTPKTTPPTYPDPSQPNNGDTEIHGGEPEVILERIEYVDGLPDYYVPIGTYKLLWNSENSAKVFSIPITEPGIYQITTICDGAEFNVTANVVAQKRFQLGKIEGKGGAGIRLKKITENPAIGIPSVRTYSYTDDDEWSTGQGLKDPHYGTSVFVRTTLDPIIPEWVLKTEMFYQFSSIVSEAPDSGLPFYYKTVTEDVLSDTDTIRTKYYFDHFPGHNEADLIKQIDFKHEGWNFTKVREVENEYQNHYMNSFGSISIYKIGETVGPGYLEPYPFYAPSSSSQAQQWKYLAYSKETTYSGAKSYVNETTNYYDFYSLNLTGVNKKNSDGSSSYTKYKYAEDYAGVALSKPFWWLANMVSLPIEEQLWRILPSGDTVLIAGKINKYNYVSKKIERIYSFESSTGVAKPIGEGSRPYTSLVFNPDLYKSKIDFTYNSFGRLTQQQLTNDVPTSYIWGYPANPYSTSPNKGSSFPIAEVKNAIPSEVFHTGFEEDAVYSSVAKTGTRSHSGVYSITGSFVGEYKLTYWKKTGSGDWTLIEGSLINPTSPIQIGDASSLIDEVRLFPIKATISTYSYKPGFGLSSVNDPNNVITHYDYDSFGRLKLIKDDKGNILKTFKYNFQK